MANISPPVPGMPVVDPNVFTPQRHPGPFVPYILDQSAVPRILPSSGSSNATGQITLTTALPYQPSGVVYIYLPAGVVTAGSAGTGAGMYPVIFSSTTVCQIQGTAVVTANGAYTQTTGSDLTLATVTVPGGAMGVNGSLRTDNNWSIANTAGAKTQSVKFSATTVASRTAGSQSGLRGFAKLSNRGNLASQVLFASTIQTPFGDGAIGGYSTIDTSINQNLTFTGQLTVATDYIILEGYTVEVLPEA